MSSQYVCLAHLEHRLRRTSDDTWGKHYRTFNQQGLSAMTILENSLIQLLNVLGLIATVIVYAIIVFRAG